MSNEEIIDFMRHGDMCKEFGCTMEKINWMGATDKYFAFKCKYCKKEAYASWQ